jgi:putative acetyltransferase
MSVTIRNETRADVAAIERVIVDAFGDAPHTSHTEQFIVNELRRMSELFISLVADDDGTLIGHVAVSPVSISDGTAGWYGLGPVSVIPARQGQGVGSRLIEKAMSDLAAAGAVGCVVVGEPAYYGRFGFAAEPSLVFPDVPPQYFRAMAFRGPMPSGTVSYSQAFESAG